MKVFAERDNVNDEEVIIASLYFKNNDKVDAGAVVCQLDTSKTAIDVEAPKAGFLRIHVTEGDEVPIGMCLFEILDDKHEEESNIDNDKQPDTPKDYIFSKEAKEKIEELGLKNYSFDKKMVSIDDVLAFIGEESPIDDSKKDDDKAPQKKVNQIEEDISLPNQPFRIEKHTLRKRSEIKNLSDNGNQSTQSLIGIEIDVLPERSYKVPFLFKKSISDLVVYESAKLLKKYPQLNSFHINEKEYGIYENINIGFSFDNESNLKVFAIEDTPSLSLKNIQKKITDLLELYESNETVDNSILSLSTITVSDLSKTQSSFMQPLVSNNQSAIIGIVNKSDTKFSVYIGFDHKVSSGLYVSNFLQELKENVEAHFYGEDILKHIKCSRCEITLEEAKNLGHKGFIKIVNFSGKEELICENCFNGF